MITAVLTASVAWCLFYGKLPLPALAALSLCLGITLAVLGRHRHTGFITIDVLAQSSKLNRINPAVKLFMVVLLMALCISSRNPMTGLFLLAVNLVLVVCIGKLRLHDYLSLLALPVSFLMISGLALMFEITSARTGVLGIHVFGAWLTVSAAAQVKTALIMSRALGALSCLYLLSLTTPMSEIIGVLRRTHCPSVVISMMYLIYRYIFVLLMMYHTMHDAAKSRLGYVDFRTNVRTTGNLYSNLLARSYRKAGRNFDAMESRCFDTEIRFLERDGRATGKETAAAAAYIIVTLGLVLLFR